MKKITFLALHLGYGGIERCIATIANSLVDKYEIEIVSTYKLSEEPAFKINENIKIKYLLEYGPNRKEISNCKKNHQYLKLMKELFKAKKILKLKKNLMIDYIKKCDSDVIISTRDIHNEWLGKYGSKSATKIGWEHNYHNNNEKYIKKIVDSIKDLDYFVLVSKELTEFYQKRTNTKCIYIPNSLEEYPTKYASLEKKNLVSIGRLSYEKGYDELIEAFRLIHEKHPLWNLNIVGDGSEFDKINNLIKKYNLEDFVKLHGFQSREYINELLFKSSIYVLPSRSESFGIVLLEAFSYGLPAVAFNRASGARELITNNWDGYLANDVNDFAKKTCELINNINRRVIMGANALKKARDYDIKKIKEKWIDLIGD